MAAPQESQQRSTFSIKTIWGLAKSPELSLDKDTLYAVIERETGKDSMRQLSQYEIDLVCRELIRIKDIAAREAPPKGQKRVKRSDEGGNPHTNAQRRYIYMLAKELGWDEKAVNGLAFKMYSVSRQEWLTPKQCSGLITALQKISERKTDRPVKASELQEGGAQDGK